MKINNTNEQTGITPNDTIHPLKLVCKFMRIYQVMASNHNPHGNTNTRNHNSDPMQADNEITFLGQSMNNLSSSLVGVLQQQNQTQLETTHILGEMKKASKETKNDIYLQSIPILSGEDPSQFDNWILKVGNAADITNHPYHKNCIR